jgi:TRAP-type C4-dicarboxylate transport system substrate-binding protein
LKTTLQLLSATAMLAIATSSYAGQKLCVFDPLGTQGDAYFFMKDYAVAAKQWGADITLKAYTDDEKVNDDFKLGKCDGLATTGIRARQFNNFSGSIDSAGGAPNDEVAKSIIALMANPKLANEMVSQDTEIVGVSPLGMAYAIVSSQNINSLATVNGKRYGILEYDTAQRLIVDKFGADPVPVTIASMANDFNKGKVDLVDIPIYAFKALGFKSSARILDYPLAYLTTQIVIHPKKFPDGYGQKSRTWVVGQMDRQFQSIKKLTNSVDPKLWAKTLQADVVTADKIFHYARISMAKEGAYSPRMMSILKKIRCQKDPSNYECKLHDE